MSLFGCSVGTFTLTFLDLSFVIFFPSLPFCFPPLNLVPLSQIAYHDLESPGKRISMRYCVGLRACLWDIVLLKLICMGRPSPVWAAPSLGRMF